MEDMLRRSFYLSERLKIDITFPALPFIRSCTKTVSYDIYEHLFGILGMRYRRAYWGPTMSVVYTVEESSVVSRSRYFGDVPVLLLWIEEFKPSSILELIYG